MLADLMLRAAIVGLGKVAWRFDIEPNRKVIWTHLGAYEAFSSELQIVAAMDPVAEAREQFALHRPQIPLVDDVATLARFEPDVVSVCTPSVDHASTVRKLLEIPSVRVIWCEKPLAMSLADAKGLVEGCARRNVRLIVGHVRRWVPLWRRLKARIDAKEIGPLRSLRISMPNRLWSIGSHAVDLAAMLGGKTVSVVGMDVPALAEDDEPTRSALLLFQSGASGVIEVTGLRAQLVVRASAFGDAGIFDADEQSGQIAFTPFVASSRYAGYTEPGLCSIERVVTFGEMSPFTEVVRDVVSCLRDSSWHARCEGSDALETMKVLATLASAPSNVRTLEQMQ